MEVIFSVIFCVYTSKGVVIVCFDSVSANLLVITEFDGFGLQVIGFIEEINQSDIPLLNGNHFFCNFMWICTKTSC